MATGTSSLLVYKLTVQKGANYFPACFCLPIFAALILERLFFFSTAPFWQLPAAAAAVPSAELYATFELDIVPEKYPPDAHRPTVHRRGCAVSESRRDSTEIFHTAARVGNNHQPQALFFSDDVFVGRFWGHFSPLTERTGISFSLFHLAPNVLYNFSPTWEQSSMKNRFFLFLFPIGVRP